jgi:hypothetical protein
MGKDKKDKEAKQVGSVRLALSPPRGKYITPNPYQIASSISVNHRDLYHRAQGKEGKKEKRARTEDDGEDSRKAAKEQAADGEAEE